MLAVASGELFRWPCIRSDWWLRYAGKRRRFQRCRDFAAFAFDGLHVAAGGYVPEVGVFEEGGVFEAVAEEAVEGDVGGPNEG